MGGDAGIAGRPAGRGLEQNLKAVASRGAPSQGAGRRPGGVVRRPDRLFALALHARGVPLAAVENAFVLAASRRIVRPPDAPPLGLIRSLAYFGPVIDEVLDLLTTSYVLALALLAHGQTHKLVYTPDGTFGYRDTSPQPWSGYRVHDPDRPAPKKVEPGEFSTQDRPGRPPSDAIVLFDGKYLSRWKPNQWKVENGYVAATTGRFETVDEFGGFQLHWVLAPAPSTVFRPAGACSIHCAASTSKM